MIVAAYMILPPLVIPQSNGLAVGMDARQRSIVDKGRVALGLLMTVEDCDHVAVVNLPDGNLVAILALQGLNDIDPNGAPGDLALSE